MRLAILFALIVALVLGTVWLLAGSWLTLLTDHVFALSVPTPTVGKLVYEGGSFRIGGLSLTLGATDNQRSDVKLCRIASGEIVLKSGGHAFLLGPQTSPVDTSGRPDFDFLPDHGDEVILTAKRSLVGWPTPFDVNFMIRTPSWKRYVYYSLVWKKRSGAELTMRWRYEQDYFSGGGWTTPVMMWNFHTGLVRVDIVGAPA